MNYPELTTQELTAEDFRNKVKEIRGKLLSGVDYDSCKQELDPYLDEMNKRGALIAKKHNKKFVGFTFRYLMR